jgi:hypothetical protein
LKIYFVHFSQQTGLKVLDPARRGTSGVGEESTRRENGETLDPAVYLYDVGHYTQEPFNYEAIYLGWIDTDNNPAVFHGKAGFVVRKPITTFIEITGVAHKIWYETDKSGGCTYNLYDGLLNLTDGYQVSYERPTLQSDGAAAQYQIQNFIIRNAAALLERQNSVGSWMNDGKDDIDISTYILDRQHAVEFAHKNKQLGVWDWRNKTAFGVGLRTTSGMYLATTENPLNGLAKQTAGDEPNGLQKHYYGITGCGI